MIRSNPSTAGRPDGSVVWFDSAGLGVLVGGGVRGHSQSVCVWLYSTGDQSQGSKKSKTKSDQKTRNRAEEIVWGASFSPRGHPDPLSKP